MLTHTNYAEFENHKNLSNKTGEIYWLSTNHFLIIGQMKRVNI